jgi:hypothetical protein
VVLRQQFPDNAAWTHPVFQHPAYESFAQRVQACLYEGESPNQLSILYQAMPRRVDHLKALEARYAQQQAHNKEQQARNEQQAVEIKALVTGIVESQAAQTAQLQLLISGSLTFRLEMPAAIAAIAATTATARQLPPALTLSHDGSSRYTSARASPTASPAPVPLSGSKDERQREPYVAPPPPTYRISRAVKTVNHL